MDYMIHIRTTLTFYISTQDAEIAWHFYLPGLTSGYMYYGDQGDMPVKQTVACNNAIAHAHKAIVARFVQKF